MKFILILFFASQPFLLLAQEWENEFSKFDSLDGTSTLHSSPILFTGSSSIRFWEDIKTDLNNDHILNRGFGGSEFNDLIENFEQVILKYKPHKLFIYSGDNDIANGKSAIETFGDFCMLYGMIKASIPKAEVFVLSIKPSPARWNFAKEMTDTNTLIEEFCDKHAHLTYIDVWYPMIGENMKPKGKLFIQDSLHMNRIGYELWTDIISKKLK